MYGSLAIFRLHRNIKEKSRRKHRQGYVVKLFYEARLKGYHEAVIIAPNLPWKNPLTRDFASGFTVRSVGFRAVSGTVALI